MRCPICNQNTPDAWKPLYAGASGGLTHGLRVEPPKLPSSEVTLESMYCANEECKQLVIRVHERYNIPPHAVEDPSTLTQTWLARPRGTFRPVDPLVPERFRRDYREATSILDGSPRMSAVLSRSLLADLLEEYAKLSDFRLDDRVDKFRADNKHPSSLREGMHHFREIGNFGAHTQKNDQAETIQVTREDAEWMLDFIDRVFDYFIVSPEKDRAMLEKWEQSIADAGRKPIPRVADAEVDTDQSAE